jgi:hypothetical protein
MKRAVIVSFGPTVGVSTNAPAASLQRCPWMWKSWKLLSMPITCSSDVLAGARLDRRRVAGVAAALDRLERAAHAGDRRQQLVQEQDVLDVGRLGAALADHDRAERAAERVERVIRAVVVVGPDADRVRRCLPRVRELLAGGDEAADARVLAQVDAVVVGRVADAVRVQRERLVEPRGVVAEVHDERVADLGVQRRASHQRRPGRACEAGLDELVDERAEVALAGDRAAVPVVVGGRRDVPAAGAGLDPVLARPAAGPWLLCTIGGEEVRLDEPGGARSAAPADRPKTAPTRSPPRSSARAAPRPRTGSRSPPRRTIVVSLSRRWTSVAVRLLTPSRLQCASVPAGSSFAATRNGLVAAYPDRAAAPDDAWQAGHPGNTPF